MAHTTTTEQYVSMVDADASNGELEAGFTVICDCGWQYASDHASECYAAYREHREEMAQNDAVVADMTSAAEPRTEGIIRQAVDLTIGSHTEPTTGPLTDTQAVDVLAAYLNGQTRWPTGSEACSYLADVLRHAGRWVD